MSEVIWLNDKEWLQKVRQYSRSFNGEPRIIFAIRKLGIKPLTPITVRTIANVMAVNKMGIPFITPKMLAMIDNTDIGTAYTKLHILGDKGALDIIYKTKNVTERGLFKYKLSSTFCNAIKRTTA